MSRPALNQINTNDRRRSIGQALGGKKEGGRRATTFGFSRRTSMAPTQLGGKNRRLSAMPSRPANPVTPGRKSNGRRKSVGRQSMLGGRSRAIPDPREIKSKQFINESIHRMVDYLEVNDYPHKHVTVEGLRRPATKDFWLIFEFLMCQIDPSWQLPTKDPQEEVAQLLKTLGYPFAVSKSAMISAGAPHTWPTLLACLSWMRELLEYDEVAVPGEDKQLDTSYHVFLGYVTRAYNSFLLHGDSEELLGIEEKAHRDFEDNILAAKASIAQKEKEKVALRAEIDRLRNDSKRPEFLKKDLTILERDVKKFTSFVDNLKDHENKIDEKFEALTKKNNTLQDDLVSLNKKCEKYQLRIKEQDANDIDAERINLESQQLNDNVNEMRRKKAKMDDKVWKVEVAVSENWDKLEKAVEEYLNLCTKLKLNSSSVDYSFKVSANHEGMPSISRDINNEIKPELEKLVSRLRAEELAHFSRLIELKNSLDQINDEAKEKEYKNNVLASEFERMEGIRIEKKARLEDELRRKLDQLEKYKQQINSTQSALAQKKELSQEKFERATAEFNDTQSRMQHTKEEYYNTTIATFERLFTYKENVQDALLEYKSHLEKVLETSM